MFKIFIVISVSLLLTGCADSVSFDQAAHMELVGFWYGIWHGFIIVFAWVISLFSGNTTIYAIYNNGGWYNFGYLLGTGILSTSVATGRKRK